MCTGAIHFRYGFRCMSCAGALPPLYYSISGILGFPFFSGPEHVILVLTFSRDRNIVEKIRWHAKVYVASGCSDGSPSTKRSLGGQVRKGHPHPLSYQHRRSECAASASAPFTTALLFWEYFTWKQSQIYVCTAEQ